jgi:hypothetical protein
LHRGNGFVIKLQRILQDSQYEKIVQWTGNGTFELRDVKEF